MDDLEDMMMMEAIRLSLAAEDERKRKEEKAIAKEAKRREKAEKKAEKKAAKSMYSVGNSSASASGSALSLALPGVGRRRGNSGSSTLLREAAAANNSGDKGKGVDRGNPALSGSPNSAPINIGQSTSAGTPSRQNLDIGLSPMLQDTVQPSPTATAPDKPSHLRQMSNASSPASSFMESIPNSLRNGVHGSSSSLDSPNASGTHLANGTPDRDGDGGSVGTEPMFNFRSLAEMIGREEEKDGAANHVEYSDSITGRHEQGESSLSSAGVSEDPMRQSVSTLKFDGPDNNDDSTTLAGSTKATTPELMITPVTPAALGPREEDSKQLGTGMSFGVDYGRNCTQW
jgi:hypothetical protein